MGRSLNDEDSLVIWKYKSGRLVSLLASVQRPSPAIANTEEREKNRILERESTKRSIKKKRTNKLHTETASFSSYSDSSSLSLSHIFSLFFFFFFRISLSYCFLWRTFDSSARISSNSVLRMDLIHWVPSLFDDNLVSRKHDDWQNQERPVFQKRCIAEMDSFLVSRKFLCWLALHQ